VGVVLKDSNDKLVFQQGYYAGRKKTNNIAEYMSCLFLISIAIELGITKLQVFGDSLLVVNQLTGVYKVENNSLRKINSGKSLRFYNQQKSN
jgi:ribonuclease HI